MPKPSPIQPQAPSVLMLPAVGWVSLLPAAVFLILPWVKVVPCGLHLREIIRVPLVGPEGHGLGAHPSLDYPRWGETANRQ